MERLLDECLAEVRAEYRSAVSKAVLHYLVLNTKERARLRLVGLSPQLQQVGKLSLP